MEKEFIKNFGIYQIRNLENNMVYIGSTKRNFAIRWRDWRWTLRTNRGKIHNHLQNAWNKYGEEAFVFEILEVVTDKEQVLVKEQHWIDKSINLYNMTKSVAGTRFAAENKEQLIPKEEHENIITLYISGLSFEELAEKYKCSVQPIITILVKNNVERRRPGVRIYTDEIRLNMRNSHLGNISSKKGRRQERLCACGKQVTEYYRHGKFSGYNKTCGNPVCGVKGGKNRRELS